MPRLPRDLDWSYQIISRREGSQCAGPWKPLNPSGVGVVPRHERNIVIDTEHVLQGPVPEKRLGSTPGQQIRRSRVAEAHP